jgi:hypothetical protein
MEQTILLIHINSLLDGDHNLTKDQREALQFIKEETSKAKTYGDLQEIAVELFKFFIFVSGAT